MLQAQPSLCDVICAYQALAHMCLREGWEMLQVGLDSVYTEGFLKVKMIAFVKLNFINCV